MSEAVMPEPPDARGSIQLEKFNPRAITILHEATLWAEAYQSGYVGSEHILLALIEQRGGPAYDLMTRHDNVEDILRGLKQMLSLPAGSAQAD
jgi:ATP-dependent Clp protease ATP-binding subunit ClpA